MGAGHFIGSAIVEGFLSSIYLTVSTFIVLNYLL